MDWLQAKFMDLEKGVFGMSLAMLLTFILTALIGIFAPIGQVLVAFSILTVVSGFTVFLHLIFRFLVENKPLLHLNEAFEAMEGLLKKA